MTVPEGDEMSDLERLDEALEVAQWVCDAFDDYMLSDGGPEVVDDALFELLNRFINGGESAMAHTLADAARAYRNLLANGERVEWCEEHELPYGDESRFCLEYQALPYEVDCVKRQALLIADPTTEEE